MILSKFGSFQFVGEDDCSAPGKKMGNPEKILKVSWFYNNLQRRIHKSVKHLR